MRLLAIFFLHCINTPSVIKAKKLLTSNSNDAKICITPACITADFSIIKNMNATADPCLDFYKFACGSFDIARYENKGSTDKGVLPDVGIKLLIDKLKLLQKKLNGSEPVYIKLIKNFYDSCMNNEHREKVKSEPLKQLLKSLGGWPVVEGQKWNSSHFDWVEFLLKARNIGSDHHSLICVNVAEDLKNNTRRIIWIVPPILGMPDRRYFQNGLSDKATKAYFDMMVKAANKLGASPETSEKELLDALNFEIHLANISPSREETRDYNAQYNTYTVKQLHQLAPQIEWLKLINGLTLHSVTEQEKVIVSYPKFTKEFAKYIAKVDKRTLANYMIWRIVKISMELLSKDWRDVCKNYQKQTTGTDTDQQVIDCIVMVSSAFPVAVGAYYVKHHFDAKSKEKASEILNYTLKEFHNLVENVDWMDEITRKKALAKVKAISSYIGYPEELLNDSLVSDIYKNLSVSPKDYFNNVLKMLKWNCDRQAEQLRKPIVKGYWKDHSTVAVVNAFYKLQENTIEFPAGYLQKPLFDKDGLYFMNFGRIGFTMGHELTHSFDDMGRQFDKEGNLKTWTDNITDTHFKEKVKCIIDQYSGYTAENGMKLNGYITQGENIADNGGYKIAYRAYNAWVKNNGKESRLAALDYTPNQLFWIGAANMWCSKYSPELLRRVIFSDAHSPQPFRVNGPFSNLAEFSKDFNCKLGSGMNPHKKCKVW